MNHTVIDPKVIAKIKKLNRQIQCLRELRVIFGDLNGLTPKQQLKLENKENKLSKIINTL